MNTDESCDEAAPWAQWRQAASDAPVSDNEMLLQIAELDAADAGRSVLEMRAALTERYSAFLSAHVTTWPQQALRAH